MIRHSIQSPHFIKALKCLEEARNRQFTPEQRRESAVELAGYIILEARQKQSYSEKRRHEILARMMRDPRGKAFLTAMTDQSFRSRDASRIADQIVYLLKKYGVPKFAPLTKRWELAAFKIAGRPLSRLLVPMIKRMLRQEMSTVILPGEESKLSKHMIKRRNEGVKVNLNHIGEAILGEEEARRRLDAYLKDLANPEVECISVKASTIYSQINLLGWEETMRVLGERLKRLYRAAQENLYLTPDGRHVPKFVYLDMEEYRDLYLTMELFKNTLEDPEFFRYSPGIVLQAYLPDAYLFQQELTSWAMKRVANGGAPIKIRIVKGANLAMEKVESSLRGWTQAPYATKAETDSNYKRMVVFACEPEHAHAVNLGIASHNVFDIAFAMILRIEKNVERAVGFEMIEGMAGPLRQVVQRLTGDMLLYCPAAKQEEFQNAVAYLIRRLDENTAKGNFLSYAFDTLPGTEEWQRQADLFSLACHDMDRVSYLPRRQQNRFDVPARIAYDHPFENEPDTDWSLPQNIKWIESNLRRWSGSKFETVPLVLGKHCIDSGAEFADGVDPSCPNVARYRYALAGEEQLEIALKTAEKAHREWSALPLRQRLLLLDEVANRLRQKRGDLIAAMLTDTAKTVAEADVEVSEAIDFVAYYRRCMEDACLLDDLQFIAKGPIVVAPPWNFSSSIPTGGIAAALAAGNAVIFKPAPEAVLVGWHLVNAFWEAGIGTDVLQFFTCRDDPMAAKMVQDPRIAAVILTGSTATARQILKLRPGIELFAETGGKNTMIVTAMADRSLAIKDLVHSAFGYSGQKCSACSLAILEKEVYNDPMFRRQLSDAAMSIRVDTPWHLSAKVNPLIREPSKALMHALTTLDDGEEWLLQPWQDNENPNMWSPGIKLGVSVGSITHQTEFFGPMLGVMCAENLHEAIRFANATPYGLTAGLHSLDEREQEIWKDNIIAGNLYINRTITGAIVQRQPFGGCKDSGYGPGAKAGGPNYLYQLMRAEQVSMPKEREPLDAVTRRLNQFVQRNILKPGQADVWTASIGSYAFHWNHFFSKAHDPQNIVGEENALYYVPRHDIVFRVVEGDASMDILRVVAAALTCGVPLVISCWTKRDDLFNNAWVKQTSSLLIVDEDETDFIKRIHKGKIKRIRMVSAPSTAMLEAAAENGCYIAADPVLANGRVELLHYLREVSLSNSYHRYGYLGLREATQNTQNET